MIPSNDQAFEEGEDRSKLLEGDHLTVELNHSLVLGGIFLLKLTTRCQIDKRTCGWVDSGRESNRIRSRKNLNKLMLFCQEKVG